jgi:hypothetical protein
VKITGFAAKNTNSTFDTLKFEEVKKQRGR